MGRPVGSGLVAAGVVVVLLVVGAVGSVDVGAAASPVVVGEVATVAGDGQARDLEGVGTQAGLDSPGPVAVLGASVYVHTRAAVMRFDTGSGAVSRVAGGEVVGCQDSAARQVAPGFVLTRSNAPSVAELCDHLGGIPGALAAASSWFLVYGPAALVQRVREDPHAYVVRPGEDTAALQHALGRIVGALSPVEAHLLEVLAGEGVDWTLGEAASAAGIEDGICAEAVRRLVLAGLVRPGDEDPTTFRVLALVRSCRSRASAANPLRFAARHVAPRQFRESA